ncbi:thermonuclease family protein [Campylobacter californiensis]|uniref:thermonuclease family protein n=1 Tax=Campylobacter californiensis TaxID=1032243 RepID=UPI001F2EEBC6|nr:MULTISPECIES: thermonuclease family protein [unclassified Campylobacter]
MLYKNKEQTIRLFGINAPEKKEPYFGKSKQILTKKINRKKVEIEHLYYDKYKRSVSKVFLRNKDISKFMVKNGHAIAFRKYSKDYIRDENYAKNKKLGLWNKAQ